MNESGCTRERNGMDSVGVGSGGARSSRAKYRYFAAASALLGLCFSGSLAAAQSELLSAVAPELAARQAAVWTDGGDTDGAGGIASTPPPNDHCWTAQQIQCGMVVIADLTTATLDPNDPNVPCFPGGGPGFANVWYAFVATTNEVKVRTCPTTFPGADSIIALYTGGCGNLIELCCNDDGCGNGHLLSEFCCQNLVIGQTYYLQVGCINNSSRGLYTVDILCRCESEGENPCPWVCPLGAIQENEPNNCGVPVDSFNAGCNNNPFADFPIQCGDTVCAEYAAANNVRDTDWYRLCVAAPTEFNVTLTVDVASIAAIVDLSAGCGGLVIRQYHQIPACETITISDCLRQGCYWLVVAPATFNGVPCPSRYMFTVDCAPARIGACCVGDGCIDNVLECDCELVFNGVFYANVTCAQIGEYCGCNLVCPPNATLENEPPGCGIPVDTFNGGCDGNVQAWSTIHCNETICGTYGAVGGMRDIDSYLLSVSGTNVVTVSFVGELPSAGVFTGFSGFGQPCGDLDFDDLRMTQLPCTSFSWTRTLNTGTYVIAVSPAWNVLNVGCPYDYILSVQCEPTGGGVTGDTNCDGQVNNFDIDCFTIAIGAGETAWHQQCNANGGCDFLAANDINGDGQVNNFDIDAFVRLISGG